MHIHAGAPSLPPAATIFHMLSFPLRSAVFIKVTPINGRGWVRRTDRCVQWDSSHMQRRGRRDLL